jgi:hypothetical protein
MKGLTASVHGYLPKFQAGRLCVPERRLEPKVLRQEVAGL